MRPLWRIAGWTGGPLAALIAVTVWLFTRATRGAEIANILAFPPAVIALALTLVSLWYQVRGQRRHGDFLVINGRLPRVRELSDPQQVGTHPALGDDALPFVRREFCDDLDQALRRGGLVVLIGESTAGKTRAAYESMRTVLTDHVFIRPSGRAALRAVPTVLPRHRHCVVWLDDLHGYLGEDGLTSNLTDLLTQRAVVIGTMTDLPEARPTSRAYADHSPDPAPWQARAVLDGATKIHVARRWDKRDLSRARTVHDPRIQEALQHADRFGLAEYVAAAPRLLDEWRQGRNVRAGHSRGAAVVAAAVDSRRAGWHGGVPVGVLRDLHERYLAEWGGLLLRPETWAEALRWATEPRYGASSLLLPVGSDRYEAFDYLAGALDAEAEPPAIPVATWNVLIEEADSASAAVIGRTAIGRRAWVPARAALDRAVAGGDLAAAIHLGDCLGEALDDPGAAAEVMRAAVDHVGHGDDHELLARIRRRWAWWTGTSGDVNQALTIIRAAVDEAAAVLGPHHPETLACRRNLGRWTGYAGDGAEALRIAVDVDARLSAALGRMSEPALAARFEVALWTADPALALRRWRDLDEDLTVETNADLLSDVRIQRATVLRRTTGDNDAAVRLLEETEAQLSTVRNVDSSDPALIRVRAYRARLTTLGGDPEAALPIARRALDGAVLQFGAASPQTINPRLVLARATGQAGNPTAALELATETAGTAAQHLGPLAPLTLSCRFEVALWTGYAGDPALAAQLMGDLAAEQERLGTPRSREAFDAHRNQAYWMCINGDLEGGRALLAEVVAGYEEIGETGMFALAAKVALTHATGLAGDADEALRLAVSVAAACTTTLGPVHPITLNGRFEEALWTAHTGGDATPLWRGLMTSSAAENGFAEEVRTAITSGSAPGGWRRLVRW